MTKNQRDREFPQRVIWLTETFRWQAAYDKLAELGILSLHLPLTDSSPLTHNTLLWQAVCQIKQYDWMILPEVEEAELFFDLLLQCRIDVRNLGHLKLLAGNREAEQAVRKRGVFCAFPGLLCACSRYGIAFDEIPVLQSIRTGKTLEMLLPGDLLAADLPRTIEALCDQIPQETRKDHTILALTEGTLFTAQQAGFTVLRLGKKSVSALLKLIQTMGG